VHQNASGSGQHSFQSRLNGAQRSREIDKSIMPLRQLGRDDRVTSGAYASDGEGERPSRNRAKITSISRRRRLITLRASPTRKFDAEASLMTLNSINGAAIRTFRELNARIHDSSSRAALKVPNPRGTRRALAELLDRSRGSPESFFARRTAANRCPISRV